MKNLQDYFVFQAYTGYVAIYYFSTWFAAYCLMNEFQSWMIFLAVAILGYLFIGAEYIRDINNGKLRRNYIILFLVFDFLTKILAVTGFFIIYPLVLINLIIYIILAYIVGDNYLKKVHE